MPEKSHKDKNISFEDSMKRLDKIVGSLENGSVEHLEEMLNLFEEGSILIKSCYEYLEKAELKVETISKNLKIEKREEDES